MTRSSLFFPLFLIVAGSLWFLRATDILPPTATLIGAALAVFGIAVLVMDGINKQSVVSGPILVYTGMAVYVYNAYLIGLSPLIAAGMVILGCLLLLARSDVIPEKMHKSADIS